MARWHLSRASKRLPVQTIAVGGDLLSGIFAPGQVIGSFPGVGWSPNLVPSGGTGIGAAVVWRHAVSAAGVRFYPTRGRGELPPPNPFLVRSSWVDRLHRLYRRCDHPYQTRSHRSP